MTKLEKIALSAKYNFTCYDNTGNPAYMWRGIQQAIANNDPLPGEALNYLYDVATNLLDCNTSDLRGSLLLLHKTELKIPDRELSTAKMRDEVISYMIKNGVSQNKALEALSVRGAEDKHFIKNKCELENNIQQTLEHYFSNKNMSLKVLYKNVVSNDLNTAGKFCYFIMQNCQFTTSVMDIVKEINLGLYGENANLYEESMCLCLDKFIINECNILNRKCFSTLKKMVILTMEENFFELVKGFFEIKEDTAKMELLEEIKLLLIEKRQDIINMRMAEIEKELSLKIAEATLA